MKKDHLLKLRNQLISYHEAEQDLIATNPTLCESEMENLTDSYIWLRLPIPDEDPGTVSDMILSGVEEMPTMCLAGILVAILKNQVPRGVQMHGLSIDNIENSFRFCISGSVSLEDLRILCEWYELNAGSEDGMCTGK